MSLPRWLMSLGLWMMCCVSGVWGQGVLITERHIPLPRPHLPPPAAHYKITQLAIDGRIDGQLADIQVSQTFHNCGSGVIEAQFVFPLPLNGAIDKVTLLVDGQELTGKLFSKEDARRRYEEIVRSMRDPALLEWIGCGLFQTSVFPIPAGQTRTVTIHYTQLLEHEQGLTEFHFPLGTAKYSAQPVEQLSLRLALETATPLKNIYSPTHGVQVQRPGNQRAIITHTSQHVVPTSDFRLFYDAHAGAVSAQLLSYRNPVDDEGYFLLLASPDIKAEADARPAKTVLFVVDKSGSMAGKKIEQARDALKFVLNNLRDDDLFNIVAYDSTVESFRPELERFSEESRQAALAYVDGLYAGGGTNIHEALTRGLTMLQDDKRPTYVLFLTDGLPTNGITDEAEIAAAAKTNNTVHARLLAFGVGHDVNSRLLDRLSREGFGLSEYVTPQENIEEHVAKVYARISAPVLSRASVTFHRDGEEKEREAQPVLVNRLYPSGPFDLFEGEQLVLVGRYRHGGLVNMTLTGQVGSEQRNYNFTGNLTKATDHHKHAFVEKLWASRRIGELIDELDLNGRNEELVQELVMLSTKHGILTPYTAFLAEEKVAPSLAASGAALQSNLALTRENLESLGAESGQRAFELRSDKQAQKRVDRLQTNDAFGGYGGSAPAPAGAAGRPLAPSSGPAKPGQPTTEAPPAAAAISTVRNSGLQTLYKRGKLVVTTDTADLDVEKDQTKIQTIQRYSTEYFVLIEANSVEENNLLSQQQADEELLVQLRGQNYLIK